MPLVEELLLPVHANSSSTKIRSLVGILFWHVPLPWRPQLHVVFYQTAGSFHTLLFSRSSLSLHGMLLLIGLGFIYSLLWPACWLNCPDRSRRSPSHVVQNIWDVYIQEVGFVPRDVREKLFTL